MTMSRLERYSEQDPDFRVKMIDRVKEETGEYPSRAEIHKKNERKKKKKMKYPIVSMLVIFFILTPVLIYSISTYYESRNAKKVNGVDHSKYEDILIKK